ncbi:MAG TPA: FecR domain-containing protein [Pyrinomonadaceae bacterium]|nr:FecR domain-containing protein [Pyrinomonadaceae bacterium]
MRSRVVYPQIKQIVYCICVICGLVLIVRAQEDEGIEGFIAGIRANAVKGDVIYQRGDGKFPLESGLRLEQGDFIRSGKDSYAELLLQPGNFLRVGADTELKIFSDQHDKMRLNLDKGSIVIELLSRDNAGFSRYLIDEATELIRVITSNAEVFINRPGIFRINTTAGGRTEVVVREGEAAINGFRVKKKRRAITANESVTVSEIDTRIEDDFDTWSRERAAQLVQANKSLKKKEPWAKRLKKGETEIEVPDESDNDNARGRVISARPGTVNFVEDGVEFGRAKEWQPLTEQTLLEPGDKLRTNVNSLAELVLFPDTHLRVDTSSEVLLEQLSGDAIALKVVRGSMIIDVAHFDRKQAPEIIIGGSSTLVAINDNGNYRVDGNTVTVREGKVMFHDRSIGGCKRIDGDTISDCDKKPVDNFDRWSQHRGEGELYNGRATVATATYLARLRRSRFRSAGFWYQEPGQTTYTFVPFTSQLFRSPYGGNYSTAFAPRGTTINRGDSGLRNPNRRGPEILRPKPDFRQPGP